MNKCLKQSEKQHPETKANNLRSEHVSSGRKDSSASTAGIMILTDAIGYFNGCMLTGRFWIPSTWKNYFMSFLIPIRMKMVRQHGIFHVHQNRDSYIPIAMQFR